jgi:4-hydroxy-3-methylbut-2-enyl diphosphate reductase
MQRLIHGTRAADDARGGQGMRVIRAEVAGMCFGVRDALTVIDGIEDPLSVTIHGELVHNEVVIQHLRARGFGMSSEKDRSAGLLPETRLVLTTAHGISDRERRRLERAGKSLIDTTCPLVLRVHQAAQRLQAEGCHVLVIGRKGHVEVQGVVEDLDSVEVLETESDVRTFGFSRLGIVCQTTASEQTVASIRAAVAARNPESEIRFIDTVCLPTKEHQRSLSRLLEQVDAVVVVGGRESNNTRQLVERCRQANRPVLHVQSAADLAPGWFQGVATVGLTAGTSTLAETIDEVHRALVWIGRHTSTDSPLATDSTPLGAEDLLFTQAGARRSLTGDR